MIHGDGDNEVLTSLFDKIEPRTTHQRHQEWFIDRCFAATSSTAWYILDKFFSLLPHDHPCVPQLLTVAHYAGKEINFAVQEEDFEERIESSSVESDALQETELSEEETHAQEILQLATNKVDEFKEQVKDLPGTFLCSLRFPFYHY